jgi:Holliday junction resolvase RusA-like endonuclease
LRNVALPPQGFKVVFTIAMPKSWTAKARQKHFGEPHKKRPDLDNLVKALCDAVHDEDSTVWNIHAIKVWGDEGSISISPL